MSGASSSGSGGLGLGRIPAVLDDDAPVTVRQHAVLGVGTFLTLVIGALAVTVLADPGESGGTGNAFTDRWVFGAIVVPAAYGIRRYLFRPRIVVDAAGVRFDNAFSSVALPWEDVADARGRGFVEIVGTDGDCARALLYGPTFAGPLTREERPAALVALIRAEAARRNGRDPLPEDYAATPLVSDLAADAEDRPVPDPVIHPRPSYGVPEAVTYLVLWTLACAVAAALA